MYVRVFQPIFKEIKISIFYCFRNINYAWDPSKMTTKIGFFEFSILLWSKSNDLGGNHIVIKNLPDYPHPLPKWINISTWFRCSIFLQFWPYWLKATMHKKLKFKNGYGIVIAKCYYKCTITYQEIQWEHLKMNNRGVLTIRNTLKTCPLSEPPKNNRRPRYEYL